MSTELQSIALASWLRNHDLRASTTLTKYNIVHAIVQPCTLKDEKNSPEGGQPTLKTGETI